MLEALFTSGSNRKFYRNSGPGPKTLEYEDPSGEVGFFGIVSEEELFTRDELSQQIPFLATRPTNSNPLEWIKLYYKGKFLFIPSALMVDKTSWNEVYVNGLIYGTDDEGSFPIDEDIAVNQIRLLKLGEHRFKVRTLQADEFDPSQITHNTSASDLSYVPSEWSDALLRAYNTTGRSEGYPSDVWGPYNPTNYEIVRETSNELPNHHLVVSLTSLRYYFRPKSDTLNGWRPVLELITQNDLLFSPLPLTVSSELDHYPLLNTKAAVLIDESSGIILELQAIQQEVIEGGLRFMRKQSIGFEDSITEPHPRQVRLAPFKGFGTKVSVMPLEE